MDGAYHLNELLLSFQKIRICTIKTLVTGPTLVLSKRRGLSVALNSGCPIGYMNAAAVDCGVPPSPQHGEVSYQNTSYLSVASYQCEAGYALEGSSQRQCTSSGTWSQTHPVCTGI